MIGRPPAWISLTVGAIAIIWVIPLVGIVVTSVRPPPEVALGWWSIEKITVTFDAWVQVWAKYPLGNAFLVSMELAGLAALGSMLLTPAAAYAFHFLRFPARRLLLIVIINAFVLPQQVLIIPLFGLWRELGLLDNIISVLVLYVGFGFAWSIYLIKNFLEDFPFELIEAATIDGAGPLTMFWRIVLPNSLSPIFAVGILQFLFCWNGLLVPMLFLRSQAPLPVVFAQMAGTYDTNWNLRSVAAIVTTAVPLIVFLIFQRQFASGSISRSGNKE